ncbi:MAG: molybdenum cofactor guanylyltransferase [Bacteroidota bacterium]
MTGLVLSGGQSRRMGTDKGMLVAENKSWVQTAFDKLSQFVPRVVISVNAIQRPLYASQFEDDLVIADDDSVAVNGPLHGLLSVHLRYPEEDLLLLACDMVSMEKIVLSALVENFYNQPGHDCYVFKNDNGYQPMAGIYTAGLLAKLLQQVQAGILHKFSMKHVLDNADTFVSNLPVNWNTFFVNYNYKEDIDFQ